MVLVAQIHIYDFVAVGEPEKPPSEYKITETNNFLVWNKIKKNQ